MLDKGRGGKICQGRRRDFGSGKQGTEGEDFGLGMSRKRVKGEAFCGERAGRVVGWIGSNWLLPNSRWSFEQ